MFEEIIKKLRYRLSLPLPGTAAHFRMAHEARRKNLSHSKIPDDARKGAVLILLYEDDFKIKTTLILRASYEGVHSAQVAFPGGKFEEGDDDLSFTALREAEEEIGIVKEDVQVIGKLTQLYIPPSNFLVQPFIGFVNYKPAFTPHAKEVQEILEINIDDLLSESEIKEKEITLSNGLTILTPYFSFHGHTVWGATAMVINEFSEVLKEV